MKKKALVLTDGKAGHENQSIAFACALGCSFDVFPVTFKSRLSKFASYIFDFMSFRVLRLYKEYAQLCDIIKRGGYDVVIGTGSGTFYAAKAVSIAMKVKCGVVLYPRGYDIRTFGCVLAPVFDNPVRYDNLIEIPANLVAIDEGFYAKGVEAFRERYTSKKERAAAVIIGGPNKRASMTYEWMKHHLDEIFAQTEGCERWVTTSRRTPADIEALVDSYPWDYKLIYSREKFNPIPAFVVLAQQLYVTAESTGMLSEACTCGSAKVFALDNLKPGGHKFRRFVDSLRFGGYVDASRKINLSGEIAKAKELLEL